MSDLIGKDIPKIKSSLYISATKSAKYRGVLSSENSLINACKEIIRVEAPITEQKLFRSLSSWFGVDFVGKIRLNAEEIIKQQNFVVTELGDQKVYWNNIQTPDEYFEYRYSDADKIDSHRTEQEIPLIEIINAMCESLSGGRFVPRLTLFEETCILLSHGFMRKNTPHLSNKVIEKALKAGIDTKRIKRFTKDTFVIGKYYPELDFQWVYKNQIHKNTKQIIPTVVKDLESSGFKVIDNKNQYEILWVIFQKGRTGEVLQIAKKHGYQVELEGDNNLLARVGVTLRLTKVKAPN